MKRRCCFFICFSTEKIPSRVQLEGVHAIIQITGDMERKTDQETVWNFFLPTHRPPAGARSFRDAPNTTVTGNSARSLPYVMWNPPFSLPNTDSQPNSNGSMQTTWPASALKRKIESQPPVSVKTPRTQGVQEEIHCISPRLATTRGIGSRAACKHAKVQPQWSDTNVFTWIPKFGKTDVWFFPF